MENSYPSTILIIDDDASMRDLLETLLSSFGMNTLTAADETTAIETLKTNLDQIGACLLDLNLGESKGEDLFDLIRPIAPNLLIFAMSGITQEEIRDRFANRDIAGIISKPFRVNQLIETIELGLKQNKQPGL